MPVANVVHNFHAHTNKLFKLGGKMETCEFYAR